MENVKFNKIILKGMSTDPKFYTRLAILLNEDKLHQLVEGVKVDWKLNAAKWHPSHREIVPLEVTVSSTRENLCNKESGLQSKWVDLTEQNSTFKIF